MSGAVTNAPIVIAKLGALVPQMRAAAAKGLRQGLEHVRTIAQTRYLSGPRPRVLDVVTTRLRNSIAIDVKDTSDGVTGRIGSNVAYAARHEFGFTGTEQVAAHARVVGINLPGHRLDAGLALRMLRGPIQDRSGNTVGFKRSGKSAARQTKRGTVAVQFVRAHSRRVNYAGRPFIRPAMDSDQAVIGERVELALKRAAEATT